MKKLLLEYGVNIIEKKEHTIFNSKKLLNKEADYDIVRKMRASILILGP